MGKSVIKDSHTWTLIGTGWNQTGLDFSNYSEILIMCCVYANDQWCNIQLPVSLLTTSETLYEMIGGKVESGNATASVYLTTTTAKLKTTTNGSDSSSNSTMNIYAK